MAEPETLTLSCGLKTIVLHDPDAEGVRLDFIIPAGTSWHPNPVAASMAIAMLREGTKKYPGPTLSRRLDYHGAFVDLQSTSDHARLTLWAHKKNIAYIIRYLVSMLTEPQYDRKYFELHRQRQLMRFRTDMLRTRSLAQRAFKSHIYGPDTCYGRLAEEKDYWELSTNDLHTFRLSGYKADHMMLIAAGRIKPEWLHAIDQGLVELNSTSFALKREGFAQNPSTGVITVQKADALQSSIVMGRLVVDRHHPDFPALTLLNTILGGYFGSRLMTNLREDKGFTYGIYSQIESGQLATKLSIVADVGAESTQKALQEIQREILRLMDEKVPEKELELVKNFLSGSFAQALDGVFNKAARLRTLAPSELSLGYYTHLLNKIRQTDSDTIRLIAQKYLPPKKMLTVIAGSHIPSV